MAAQQSDLKDLFDILTKLKDSYQFHSAEAAKHTVTLPPFLAGSTGASATALTKASDSKSSLDTTNLGTEMIATAASGSATGAASAAGAVSAAGIGNKMVAYAPDTKTANDLGEMVLAVASAATSTTQQQNNRMFMQGIEAFADTLKATDGKKLVKVEADPLFKEVFLVNIALHNKLLELRKMAQAFREKYKSDKEMLALCRSLTIEKYKNDPMGMVSLGFTTMSHAIKINELFGLTYLENSSICFVLSNFIALTRLDPNYAYNLVGILIYLKKSSKERRKKVETVIKTLDPTLQAIHGQVARNCMSEFQEIIGAFNVAISSHPDLNAYLERCNTFFTKGVLSSANLISPSEATDNAAAIQKATQEYFQFVNELYLEAKKEKLKSNLDLLSSKYPTEDLKVQKERFLSLFDGLKSRNRQLFEQPSALFGTLKGFQNVFFDYEKVIDLNFSLCNEMLAIIEEDFDQQNKNAATKTTLSQVLQEKTKELILVTHAEIAERDRQRSREIKLQAEAAAREQRKTALLTQQTMEKERADKAADDERALKLREQVKQAMLEKAADLHPTEIALLEKIINKENLHHSIDENEFVKLARKLGLHSETSDGYDFRLGNKVADFHRVHAGDKMDAKFLKKVSGIFEFFNIKIEDIPAKKQAEDAQAVMKQKK